MAKGLSAAKAKKILKDGYVKGKPLTAKQIKYFGAIANGATPLKAINGGWLDKYQDGGDVPKAQRGKILKLAKDLYKMYKGTDKVVDAANTVKKTDKVVSNSLNPLEIADQIIPRFNVLGPVGGDIMQLSPLNAIPFYGKNLKGKNMAFRKFGNSIYDVIQRQALSPVGGSDFRMGKNQIVSEGNWAAMSRPSENYSGVFEATFDFNNPFANLSPTGISQRNGVLITDKLGNRLTEIPLTEPGLSFNRRLPFSTRYVPIDKQKLIDDKSQLATFGPRLQSLAEKYGIGLLGAHLVGEEDTYNKYTIDPIIENTEKVFNDLKKMKSDDDNKDKLKDGGWLDKFGMGGSLPGASGMMYSRNSTTTPEEPKKAQNGKAIDWSKQRKKYPGFMDNLKDEIEYDPEFVDFDSVRRAVRNVESLDGKLMWNPESTATGLYGQRFSEIKNDYPGTRKDFVKDTVAQNEFFKRRFYDGLEASETTPLLQDANDLYNDYLPQIKNFPYSKEDIAVLSNFIGRGGTRKYLGYAIRDGKPLAEALPNVYGPSAKQSNKTPEEYLELARQYYKTNELKNGGRCWPGYKTVSGKTPFSKGSCQKAQVGTIQGPISKREDFDGNWLSSMAAGNQRKNSYGNLGDLYRYFGGMDLKNKALYKSKYKPTNSKNPNAEYIAIKDSGFTNTVLDQASRIFVDGNIKSTNEYGDDYIDRKINDDTYGIPRQPGDAGAIGKFFISRGSDEEGDYISYYDVFDVGQPNSPNTFGELLGSVKPFEIYDRIYVKKDKKGKYIQKKNGGDVPKAQDGTSMISQYEEPAWYEKLLDYAASPMTTLGYLAKGQDLPDRIPINVPGRSEFDNWTFDTINPAAYIKYGASALRNLDKGEYLDATFDAVSAIPILPAFLKRGKKLPVKGIDLEKTPFINAFTKPTRSVSGPLPKELEPYLSRRVYPFNKEQEVFESFLSTDRQLKNIDSKSINYDLDGNIIPKNFESSIDWKKWVKYTDDFDNNPDVIKHLNEIEKTTKANGTWMKNPDGSAFKGTQEEFVIQQSDNFKKAFKNTQILHDGRPAINIHGTEDNIEIFDVNKIRNRAHGNGIYFTPEGVENTYGSKQIKAYINSENPFISDNYEKLKNSGYSWTKDYFPELSKHTSTAPLNMKGNIMMHVVPDVNRIKSAKGNILFDMTNPNIYKAIVPAAIGTAASQMTGPVQEDGEFKNGGWLDKYQDGGSLDKVQNLNEVDLGTFRYVKSEDDPRYKAFQDSSQLYNKYKRREEAINQYGNWNTPTTLRKFYNSLGQPVDIVDDNIHPKINSTNKKTITKYAGDISPDKVTPTETSIRRDYDVNIYNEPNEKVILKGSKEDKRDRIKYGYYNDFGEMKFDVLTSDWNSKQRHKKAKNKTGFQYFQDGGVIEDNRGQWAYPGEITKINSNNITMKGVNYPVLGISDTGDKKMMQPGKDYKFDGNSVTEYPMAQNGDKVVKDFMSNYINSPKFKERLASSNYNDVEGQVTKRSNNIDNTNYIEQEETPDLLETFNKMYKDEPYSTSGSKYDERLNTLIYDKKQDIDYGIGKNSVIAHEYGHAALDGTPGLGDVSSSPDKRFLLNDYDSNELTSRLRKYKGQTQHDLNPTENKSDLDAFRFELSQQGVYDAGKEDITKDILKKGKDSFIKKRLLKNYKEKDLIWLMNNIASLDNSVTEYPMAKDGKSLVELNQLTNFTNYNTPQPGGWLNKYN